MVVPAAVRSALVEHAEAERPNEACGVVVFKDGQAERYIPGTNLSESPYRYELQVPPETWFLEDDGFELAVFHSHVSSPPRPSRTDVENIGLWEGKPYLILSLRTGELPAGGSPTGGSSPSPSPRRRRSCRASSSDARRNGTCRCRR